MVIGVTNRTKLVAALAPFLLARGVGAQEQASVTFFHGRNGESRILSDFEGRSNTNRRSRFSASLRVGTEVCVVVQNAHPANYTYTLGVAIDTPVEELPDVSTFDAFVKALPKVAALTDRKPLSAAIEKNAEMLAFFKDLSPDERARAVTGVESMPLKSLTELTTGFTQLAREIAEATQAANASDAPGTVDERNAATTGGFREAVDLIAALSKEKLHFNDPKLKDNLQALVAEAEKEAKGSDADPVLQDIVSGLAGYAELLLVKRDHLKAAYASSTRATPRICKTVVEGKNTFSLTIAKKGETGERDVTPKDSKGGDFFTLEVQSRFERKVVSVDPLSLMVLTWNVPQFQVQGDTLLAPSTNPTLARPGLMLSINPVSWGANGDWGFGIGLGLGVSASDAVTDALAGATVTFRNSIRFGIGYGRSKQHESVKGAVVGKPLPANLGKLEDAVQSGGLTKDAVYFLITVPGIALKTK